MESCKKEAVWIQQADTGPSENNGLNHSRKVEKMGGKSGLRLSFEQMQRTGLRGGEKSIPPLERSAVKRLHASTMNSIQRTGAVSGNRKGGCALRFQFAQNKEKRGEGYMSQA